MKRGEKIAAIVGALAGVVLVSVPASRDFVIELSAVLGVLVYFGLALIWHWSLDHWMVITGVAIGVLFVAAVIVRERKASGGRHLQDRHRRSRARAAPDRRR